MKIKNLGKKNIILLSIIAVLLLIVGGSLAFFGWSSTSVGNDRIVDVTITSGGGECEKATDNTKMLVPTSSKEKGRVITINAKQNMAKNASITWTLTVNSLNAEGDTSNGLKDESFKYELRNKTTGVSYGSGNFSNITTENNTITFSTREETLDYNVNYEFVLYLWIDGLNFDSNSLDMTNQNYDFNMVCNITGVDAKVEAPKYLSSHVSNLYTPNDTVRNGDNTYGITNYNLDTDDNLIADIDGNIRYYGANPNNYIYFNCDTYPETGCEKWRIIGVFDDKVKLIKNEPIGVYSWDYDYNDDQSKTTSDNDWTKSSLNKLLNDAYLNNKDTTYYNYSSDGAVKKDVKFNSNGSGLKDDTRDFIAEVTYNLGSAGNYPYPKNCYEFERATEVFPGNEIIWSGKIALANLSDYGYASDLNGCNQYLINYNNTGCVSTNWMKAVISNTSVGMLLTVDSWEYNKVSAIATAGQRGATYVYNSRSVTPVLYLNANTVMSTVGDGSNGNPYRLIVE